MEFFFQKKDIRQSCTRSIGVRKLLDISVVKPKAKHILRLTKIIFSMLNINNNNSLYHDGNYHYLEPFM